MPLDSEIRKHLIRFIEARLEPETTPKEIMTNGLRKVWKLESNQYEFLYGEMIGFLMGIGTGMVFEKYKREVLPDETDEIGDIVESHASKIRDYLATFKQ